MSALARCTAGLALGALAASTARAQGTTTVPVSPFSFGVSGGLAIPVGDAGDALNSGYTVQLLGTVKTPELPVRLRGEVGYTSFGIKDGDGNARLVSGVANLVVPFAAAPSQIAKPYLIGGIGVYNAKVSGGDGETKAGFNIGAGVDLPFPSIGVFGEVRFVTVRTEGSAFNYFPITVGVRF